MLPDGSTLHKRPQGTEKQYREDVWVGKVDVDSGSPLPDFLIRHAWRAAAGPLTSKVLFLGFEPK